jgi:hypothetical protein
MYLGIFYVNNMLTDFLPNTPNFFVSFCYIKTDNKKYFNKHLLTSKDKKNENLTNIERISPITHSCKKCNKIYKSRVGLWYLLIPSNSE